MFGLEFNMDLVMKEFKVFYFSSLRQESYLFGFSSPMEGVRSCSYCFIHGWVLVKWDPPGVAAPSWLGQNLNLAPLVGNFPCRSKLH